MTAILWVLWIPPALPYYQLAGPFAEVGLQDVTKQLVFSFWQMVPRAISTLLSYDAERRMMLYGREEAPLDQKAWQNQGDRLRFQRTKRKGEYSSDEWEEDDANEDKEGDRLTGLPLLLHCYPCRVLAREADPLLWAGKNLTASEVLTCMAERIKALIEKLNLIRLHRPELRALLQYGTRR